MMKREITLRADELAAVRDEAPISSARSVDAIRKAVFLRAAAHGDLDVLEVLIAAGTDLAVQDAQGWTALHLACQAHAVQACEMLLEAGAPVDAPDHLGHTPLHRAVFESAGRGELIGLLRAYGADPHRKNAQGVTPLALARSSRMAKIASYFGDLPATPGGLWDRFRTKKKPAPSSGSCCGSSAGPDRSDVRVLLIQPVEAIVQSEGGRWQPLRAN